MAMSRAAKKISTRNGRRACRSIVLKLRNRTVLTISSAGITTSRIAGSDDRNCTSPSG